MIVMWLRVQEMRNTLFNCEGKIFMAISLRFILKAEINK